MVFGSVLSVAPAGARVPSSVADRLVLFVDGDDDDDDGVADGTAARVAGAAARDLLPLPAGVHVDWTPSALFRVIADGRPVTAAPGRRGTLALQGAAPGTASLSLEGAPFELAVLDALLVDGRGARIDLARSHVSLSHRLPTVASSDAARSFESPNSSAIDSTDRPS